MPLVDAIATSASEMTGWRRHLHAHPELGFKEHATARFIEERLTEWGIPHQRLAGTGIVATIRKGTGSGAIGLRADMDALPMTEATNLPWRSTVEGVMHACGHDGHMATMLGAAKYLAGPGRFDGTVHLIFQPAEEGLAGARVMIEEGLFEKFPCDMVFGAHNDPLLPEGQLSVVVGPVMAASDRFTINVEGKGGHAARPHHSIDPLIAGAHVALALQTIVARRIDPLESAVLSITEFHSGTTGNVIPDSARLNGTVRTLQPYVQTEMERLIPEVVASAAAVVGASASVEYVRGYPPVVNDAAAAAIGARAATMVVGADAVLLARPPSMGGEDFAFMALARPACFARIGIARPDGSSALLHNTGYDFNDDMLAVGASYFSTIVETALPAR